MEKMWISLMFMLMLMAMGIIAHASKTDFENSLVNIGEIGESNGSYLIREKRAKKRGSKRRKSNREKNRNRGGGEEDWNRDDGEEEPPKQR